MQTEVFRFGNAIVDDWEGPVNAWPLDEGLLAYVDPSRGGATDANEHAALNVVANTVFTRRASRSTLPIGMNIFVIKGITNGSLSDVVRGAFPYVLLMLLGLILLLLFPGLANWLPYSAGFSLYRRSPA